MNRGISTLCTVTLLCSSLISGANITTPVSPTTTARVTTTRPTTRPTTTGASITTTLSAAVTQNISNSVANDLTASASGSRSAKSRAATAFSDNFATCKRNSPEFDKCIRDGLNNVRSYIPRGVPELNIPSFDPIHAKEVVLKRGGPNFGYKLKLKNVIESGWKLSEVTKFKSNLKLNTVQMTQYFPDKHLAGEYEFESLILTPTFNKGQFNLSLYELNQTTTLSKPRNSKSIKVNVDVQEIGDMKLHISNLLRGRTRMENILDRMINSAAWRPGFLVVRPFVNELVSTAFTEIYNKAFNNFDWETILPPPS